MPEYLEIPLNADEPSFKLRTVLEDVEVVLLIHWNTRSSRWNLSIMDSTETPLLMGIPLHVDTEILERFEIDGLPPGRLFLYDLTTKSMECGRDELGDRCRLIYQTSV